jgi:preprotein translocase subunit SecA
LLRVYGLPSCKVPLRVPSLRDVRPTVLAGTQAQKWAWVVERAMAEAARGRPVLIGTDTVADSDAVSLALARAGQAHQVLNARQDEAEGQQEQDVVSRAGEPGCVTVATHMAGRGTDVHLSDEAIANGGLHVINTNLNRSRRIDRQLIGRCARQGKPGSCETILSWEDSCWRELAGEGWLRTAVSLARRGLGGAVFARWLCGQAQQEGEARSRRRRWSMLVTEMNMARHLAMAGSEEWD